VRRLGEGKELNISDRLDKKNAENGWRLIGFRKVEI